jgi:hypothetical protein
MIVAKQTGDPAGTFFFVGDSDYESTCQSN